MKIRAQVTMTKIKKEYRDKGGLEIAKACAHVAQDNKAEDVVILDVQGLSSFTDYFVIMSGRSTRHVQGLAETIEAALRSKRVRTSKAEGLQEAMWVLLDFDEVVVHIFYHDQRGFDDLEALWYRAPRIRLEDVE